MKRLKNKLKKKKRLKKNIENKSPPQKGSKSGVCVCAPTHEHLCFARQLST